MGGDTRSISGGTIRSHPGKMRDGSVKIRPSDIVRPRLAAARSVQASPSPSSRSAIVQRQSPVTTVQVDAVGGLGTLGGVLVGEGEAGELAEERATGGVAGAEAG
jgi:translation initiation factor IF-1